VAYVVEDVFTPKDTDHAYVLQDWWIFGEPGIGVYHGAQVCTAYSAARGDSPCLITFSLFVRSLTIGLSIAAPVGPIGVLCIRRTLAHGRWTGVFSGMGAATADAVYGCIAAFGLTLVSDLLLSGADVLRLVGGVFLGYLGVRTLLARPAEEEAAVQESPRAGLAGAYASTFALTLTNPMTILAFVGIFAGLGADAAGDYGGAVIMVLGVFAGSALWWLLLSGGVSLLRDRFDAHLMLWVNRLSGAVILIFALDLLRRLV
jgi:threonine/homoserine/homoserine lactone efflux protein